MPLNLGAPELILGLLIVLIIFGAGKLPEIGGAMGKAMREFRGSVTSKDEEAKALEGEDTGTKKA